MALSLSFKGKKILVTGAARGLGRDLVETLYAQGAIIIAVSRSPDNLSKLKSDFPNISTISVDLSNWDETRKALSSVKGVEYLINNAGMVHIEPFMNVTAHHFDE
jgi:short-subunit dehydrogenase